MRELESEIEDLSSGPVGDYPDVTLCEVLGYDFEPVDRDRRLWRAEETGQVYHVPKGFLRDLGQLLSEGPSP